METIKELRKICQSEKTKNPSLAGLGYTGHRVLSIYITRIILKLAGKKIKPNHISVFNILLGITVLVFIAIFENKLFLLLFLLLFYFSFLLDKVDGEIAKYQKLVTLRGTYLDEVYHIFVQNGLILALSINRFMASGENLFLFFGAAGFFLFLLSRYMRKLKYFVYAKYWPDKDEFSIKKELTKREKLFIGFLNMFLLKLCSISRRHDIFLFLALFLSVFCSGSIGIWLWFLSVWTVMLAIYVLRFLFLNYLFIDRHIQLIDENKL